MPAAAVPATTCFFLVVPRPRSGLSRCSDLIVLKSWSGIHGLRFKLFLILINCCREYDVDPELQLQARQWVPSLVLGTGSHCNVFGLTYSTAER